MCVDCGFVVGDVVVSGGAVPVAATSLTVWIAGRAQTIPPATAPIRAPVLSSERRSRGADIRGLRPRRGSVRQCGASLGAHARTAGGSQVGGVIVPSRT